MSLASYNNIFAKSFPKSITLTFSEEGQSDIVLTNTYICEEDMSLEESLCSETNLKYGTCESSCFKVRVVNNNSFKGKWLTVTMALRGISSSLIDSDGDTIVDANGDAIAYYDSSESTSITIGRYKVDSDVPTNDRMWRDLVCYDVLHDILSMDVATWYSGLTFPMTIKNFRDSFFNYVGVTQETVTLIGDNLQIEGGFIVEGTLAGKTIIESICELNGVFGHINASGNFEYVSLPSSETVTYEWYIDGTGSYEDYITDKITGIKVIGETSDVGTSVGTTDNVYVIQGNPLVYGLEGTTALTNHLTALLNKIKDFQYRPYRVETYGNPMLPVGTSIVINAKKYTPDGYVAYPINSFVMQRNLDGIQAIKDTISATGDKAQPTRVNSIQSQITRTKGKVHILENTVDELSSEITAVSKLSIPILPVTRWIYNTYDDGRVQYQIVDEPELDYLDFTFASSDRLRFAIRGISLSDYYNAKKKEIYIKKGNTEIQALIRNLDNSVVTTEIIADELITLEYYQRTSGNPSYFWVLPDSYASAQNIKTNTLIQQTADAINLKVSETVHATVPTSDYTDYVTDVSTDTITFKFIDLPIFELIDITNSTFRFGMNVPDNFNDTQKARKKAIRIESTSGGTSQVITAPIFNEDGTQVTNEIFDGKVVYLERATRTIGSSTVSGFWLYSDSYTQSQINMVKDKIVLKVDNNGNIVQVALGADASTGSVFTVNANNINLSASDIITLMAGGTITLGGQNGVIISGTNFSVDAQGNATLTGEITATSGSIGGWTIGTNKISGGDSTTGVAVVQRPTANTTWVFGAGGTSHSSYADCPFKVSKNGSVFTKYLNITDGGATSGAAGTAYIGWDAADQAINMVVYNRQGSGLIGFRGSTGNITCHDLDTDEINLRSGYLRWVNAVSDWATIRAGAYGGQSDQGYLNIATGDNGNEEIIVTQNTGAYNTPTEVRRATLLSDTGNTQFPGSVTATSFINGSSKKIKKNIEDISLDEAEKIMQLRPVKFDFKSVDTDEQHERGFIAEEVEKIYPDLISEERGTEGKSDFVPKSLNYIGMIPYLVKMIQNQQDEISNLKQEINKLKTERMG